MQVMRVTNQNLAADNLPLPAARQVDLYWQMQGELSGRGEAVSLGGEGWGLVGIGSIGRRRRTGVHQRGPNT